MPVDDISENVECILRLQTDLLQNRVKVFCISVDIRKYINHISLSVRLLRSFCNSFSETENGRPFRATTSFRKRTVASSTLMPMESRTFLFPDKSRHRFEFSILLVPYLYPPHPSPKISSQNGLKLRCPASKTCSLTSCRLSYVSSTVYRR